MQIYSDTSLYFSLKQHKAFDMPIDLNLWEFYLSRAPILTLWFLVYPYSLEIKFT